MRAHLLGGVPQSKRVPGRANEIGDRRGAAQAGGDAAGLAKISGKVQRFTAKRGCSWGVAEQHQDVCPALEARDEKISPQVANDDILKNVPRRRRP